VFAFRGPESEIQQIIGTCVRHERHGQYRICYLSRDIQQRPWTSYPKDYETSTTHGRYANLVGLSKIASAFSRPVRYRTLERYSNEKENKPRALIRNVYQNRRTKSDCEPTRGGVFDFGCPSRRSGLGRVTDVYDRPRVMFTRVSGVVPPDRANFSCFPSGKTIAVNWTKQLSLLRKKKKKKKQKKNLTSLYY